eukprot:GHVR01014495.1.p1 GENE.GHVR01014495.1~~GHVR01014495.1.p1  ORF type:complete len:148 (-),score=8.77 GHVR01014495.1:1400-1843(-)
MHEHEPFKKNNIQHAQIPDYQKRSFSTNFRDRKSKIEPSLHSLHQPSPSLPQRRYKSSLSNSIIQNEKTNSQGPAISPMTAPMNQNLIQSLIKEKISIDPYEKKNKLRYVPYETSRSFNNMTINMEEAESIRNRTINCIQHANLFQK